MWGMSGGVGEFKDMGRNIISYFDVMANGNENTKICTKSMA